MVATATAPSITFEFFSFEASVLVAMADTLMDFLSDYLSYSFRLYPYLPPKKAPSIKNERGLKTNLNHIKYRFPFSWKEPLPVLFHHGHLLPSSLLPVFP